MEETAKEEKNIDENRMRGTIQCDVHLKGTAEGYLLDVMLSTTNAVTLIKVQVCSKECFQVRHYCSFPLACVCVCVYLEEP